MFLWLDLKNLASCPPISTSVIMTLKSYQRDTYYRSPSEIGDNEFASHDSSQLRLRSRRLLTYSSDLWLQTDLEPSNDHPMTRLMTLIRVLASRHHSKQKQAAMRTPSFLHQTSTAASDRLLALCLWSTLLVLEVCLWVRTSELSVCMVSRSPMILLSLCTSLPTLAKTAASLKMFISNALLVKTAGVLGSLLWVSEHKWHI